jgi:hypothetical protein
MLLRRKRSNPSFNLAQPPRSEKAKLGLLKFLALPHGHRGNEDGSPLQYRTMDSGRRSVTPIDVSSREKSHANDGEAEKANEGHYGSRRRSTHSDCRDWNRSPVKSSMS